MDYGRLKLRHLLPLWQREIADVIDKSVRLDIPHGLLAQDVFHARINRQLLSHVPLG